MKYYLIKITVNRLRSCTGHFYYSRRGNVPLFVRLSNTIQSPQCPKFRDCAFGFIVQQAF